MTERKTVHESVLVGYFCQACGWIQRDIESRRTDGAGESTDRLLRAVNLSHNPLDPAVGDLILQFDTADVLPEKFFIFELKTTWEGRHEERKKLFGKFSNAEQAKHHVIALLREFPSAWTSHLFGGLAPTAVGERRVTVLHVGCYWEAVGPKRDVVSRSSVFHWLDAIVQGKAAGGMEFDDLAAYIDRLNSQAEAGSAAQSGAGGLVVAYRDYQLYLFQEDAVRELSLRRAMRRETESQAQREQSCDRGLGL